jgi:hypothetical protein
MRWYNGPMRASIVVSVLALVAVDASADSVPDFPAPMITASSTKSAVGGTASVAGTVTYGDGTPVKYFGVLLLAREEPYIELPAPVTSKAGAFKFKNIAAGSWTVMIVGPGFARWRVKATFADGKLTDLGKIKVEDGVVVSGIVIVIDKAKKPVGGLTVEARGIAGGGAMFSMTGVTADDEPDKPLVDPVLAEAANGTQSTVTDAKGRFTIKGVGASKRGVSVTAHADPQASDAASVEVEDPTQWIQIVYDRSKAPVAKPHK